jgi:hypothetical protein
MKRERERQNLRERKREGKRRTDNERDSESSDLISHPAVASQSQITPQTNP